MSDVPLPSHFDLMWPTIQALTALGGSGRNDEISEAVATSEGFSDEQVAVKRRDGDSMSMIDYRLAWARNELKNIGAIESSTRGVWALTEQGRALDQDAMVAATRAWRGEYNRQYQARKAAARAADDSGATTDDSGGDSENLVGQPTPTWRDRLLARLMQLSPDAFERLAQRLLREAGFRNVMVLGKSGDGGIDGVGVYRVSLVSFPV